LARSNHFWKRVNKGFDSKFEKTLHEGALSHCEYHPEDKFNYSIPHYYKPDFVWKDSGKTYLIEAKGNFTDTSEASKYKHIRDSLPEDVELVFLFQHPGVTMPRAKLRKDGTKATNAEWAEKNGFRYYSEKNIGELFCGK